MTRKFFAVAVLALLSFSAVTAVFSTESVKSPLPGVKRVVLIGADGFGAHYVRWNELPNLNKMKENGAWTLHMRCVMPSVSAINWASILMGAPSEMHGFREWGSKKPDIKSIYLTEKGLFPCIFSVLRNQRPEAGSSAVYDWDGIGYLYQQADVNQQKTITLPLTTAAAPAPKAPAAASASKAPASKVTADDKAKKAAEAQAKKIAADKKDISDTKLKTELVAKTGLEYLTKDKTLCFIYFGEPDHIGHKLNWGSAPYQQSMVHVDQQIGKILAHLKKNDMDKDTIVIFIADHGGTEKGHGKGIMEHMEVPWIIYGPGVKKGELKDVIVNYDNAATIAWILGLKQPQAWRGQAITSAFEKK